MARFHASRISFVVDSFKKVGNYLWVEWKGFIPLFLRIFFTSFVVQMSTLSFRPNHTLTAPHYSTPLITSLLTQCLRLSLQRWSWSHFCYHAASIMRISKTSCKALNDRGSEVYAGFFKGDFYTKIRRLYSEQRNEDAKYYINIWSGITGAANLFSRRTVCRKTSQSSLLLHIWSWKVRWLRVIVSGIQHSEWMTWYWLICTKMENLQSLECARLRKSSLDS